MPMTFFYSLRDILNTRNSCDNVRLNYKARLRKYAKALGEMFIQLKLSIAACQKPIQFKVTRGLLEVACVTGA